MRSGPYTGGRAEDTTPTRRAVVVDGPVGDRPIHPRA
jgi:hypothetical protein